jgi:CelD/BcsL family acetyltransferase involved in cellulose biosynthesis
LAILPLEIKKYYFLNVLQWIGTGKADYCNPIVIKNFSSIYNREFFLNVWNKILQEIKKEIDIIFLNNQLNYIENILNPFTDALGTSKFSSIYKIYFDGSFDDYFDSIKKKNKKHSYEIHRTLLKFEKLKNMSKKLSFETKDLLNQSINFKKIIDEKKSQLIKKNIRARLNSNFINIFENLINTKKIQFYLHSLKLEDNEIAKCFGFVYENTFYYYIPVTFSTSMDNFKPGKILITQIIKWCIKKNIKNFDFGLGSEKYKKYFSNKVISLHRYLSFFTIKGFFAYLFIFMLLKFKKI